MNYVHLSHFHWEFFFISFSFFYVEKVFCFREAWLALILSLFFTYSLVGIDSSPFMYVEFEYVFCYKFDNLIITSF